MKTKLLSYYSYQRDYYITKWRSKQDRLALVR